MNPEPLLAPLLGAVPGAVPGDVDGLLSVDVPASSWVTAAAFAASELGCTFFDFLSAVDEGDRFTVLCHVAAVAPFAHVVLRTRLSAESPSVGSLQEVYAGAEWHERETAEMFGITFLSAAGEPLQRAPLLLPPEFVGHPLRKDQWLAARQERPWPGAKEPGGDSPRRRLRPPGVPEEVP